MKFNLCWLGWRATVCCREQRAKGLPDELLTAHRAPGVPEGSLAGGGRGLEGGGSARVAAVGGEERDGSALVLVCIWHIILG